MQLSQSVLDVLIENIRKIAKKEIQEAMKNVETVVTGVVKYVNSDGTVNVALSGEQGIYTHMLNRTGQDLSYGDVVTLKGKGGNFGNGYVSMKNGTNLNVNEIVGNAISNAY